MYVLLSVYLAHWKLVVVLRMRHNGEAAHTQHVGKRIVEVAAKGIKHVAHGNVLGCRFAQCAVGSSVTIIKVSVSSVSLPPSRRSSARSYGCFASCGGLSYRFHNAKILDRCAKYCQRHKKVWKNSFYDYLIIYNCTIRSKQLD